MTNYRRQSRGEAKDVGYTVPAGTRPSGRLDDGALGGLVRAHGGAWERLATLGGLIVALGGVSAATTGQLGGPVVRSAQIGRERTMRGMVQSVFIIALRGLLGGPGGIPPLDGRRGGCCAEARG